MFCIIRSITNLQNYKKFGTHIAHLERGCFLKFSFVNILVCVVKEEYVPYINVLRSWFQFYIFLVKISAILDRGTFLVFCVKISAILERGSFLVFSFTGERKFSKCVNISHINALWKKLKLKFCMVHFFHV